MATSLTRAQVTATDRKKFTFSCWLKRGVLSTQENFFTSLHNASNEFQFRFDSDDELRWVGSISGSAAGLINTKRLFRDTSGWYNMVIAGDTTQATNIDRLKLYINGEQIADGDLNSPGYPGQDTNFGFGTTDFNFCFGVSTPGTTNDPFTGIITHAHFIDGTAYAASTFGSTDATTGQWEINTSPTVTYGNNGFFILKNSNSLTDESGNANNFTLASGTLTNTEDCPSNVFSTYNPLDNYYANSTFSNGNTTIVTNSGNTTYNMSTLGIPPTMKCYWEAKFDTIQAANGEVGIVNTPPVGSSSGSDRLYYQTYGISVNDGGAIWSDNADTGITLGTLSTSDVVCFAWDGVNQALYVRKNADAWINSGDPTSGASKTGAVKSFSGTSLTMFPAVGDQSGSHAVGTSTNFGNGIFGTTAISSEGTNASGIGKFEYDVPTGYTALSTKGLNL